jgi:hypothetical protein
VILARNVVLDATPKQAAHRRRACGTKRYAYNWGLAEWQHRHKAGDKPTIAVVKRRWNAHRKAELSVPSRGAGVSCGKRFNGRMTFNRAAPALLIAACFVSRRSACTITALAEACQRRSIESALSTNRRAGRRQQL